LFILQQRGLKGCYRKKSDPMLPVAGTDHRADSVSGSHNSVSLHSLSSCSDGEPDEEDPLTAATRPAIYRSASTNLHSSQSASNTTGSTFGALPDQEYCTVEDEQPTLPAALPCNVSSAPIALPPPPPLPPRNPTQQAIRRACKRQDIIKELIATEKTHVKNLKILNDLFFVPIYTEQLLSTDQIDSVFANHAQLYELHCQIYQLFKQRKKEQQRTIQRQLEFPRQNIGSANTLPGDLAIGATLVQIFDGDIGKRLERAASNFCAKQTTGQEVLRVKLRKDSKLATFLAEAEANKCCRRLQLKDMLASCFQRITKYPLLMDTLLKAMENVDTDEYHLVEQACKKSKQILHNVNECVKLAENRAKLIDLQRKTEIMLPEAHSNFEFNDKELLHQGQLTIRFVKKSFEVLLLLCTDCLIVLVKEGDRLCLKNINKAAHPVIQIKNVLTRNNATDCRAFYLISKQENFMYEFVAGSETERNHWLKQINETALKCGGGSAVAPVRSTEIKLRDLTAKDDSNDKLKEVRQT
jgi:Rho guanine nucleotide exchange factor 12